MLERGLEIRKDVMRFVRLAIFASIIGLLVYCLMRQRRPEDYRRIPESKQYNRLETDNSPQTSDGIETPTTGQSSRVKAPAPEIAEAAIVGEEVSDAMVHSSSPYTPSLLQGLEEIQQDARNEEEVAIPASSNLEDHGGAASAILQFDLKVDVEPRQHPGHRTRTGPYFPQAAQRLPRPILKCREKDGEWLLYLESPAERGLRAIRHDGRELDAEQEVEIETFGGRITINYEDGTSDVVNLFYGSPMFFRSDSTWEEDGTLVRSHSSGYFIVIAPSSSDDEFIDVEELEPEECIDPDFHAHFLAIGTEDSRELRGQYPMTLEGTTLYDVADRDFFGELFVGQPPELTVPEEVRRARIVEETGRVDENGWGRNFDPHVQSISSVLKGRQGRFTVRTYLRGSRARHESKPFRYCREVRRIVLAGETYSPGTILAPDELCEYKTTSLRLEGTQGIVEPDVEDPYVTVLDDGEVEVPPNHEIKVVNCELACGITVHVEIPRIWWRLCLGDERRDWNDIKPIYRKDFVRIAREGAYLEILLPTNVTNLRVGIGETTDQRVRKVQDRATINLRDFADHQILEQLSAGTNTQLSAWIIGTRVSLMTIGVLCPKVKKRSPSRGSRNTRQSWSVVRRGDPKRECRLHGHHWVNFKHEPGEPIEEVPEEERECRRCGAAQIRTG